MRRSTLDSGLGGQHINLAELDLLHRDADAVRPRRARRGDREGRALHPEKCKCFGDSGLHFSDFGFTIGRGDREGRALRVSGIRVYTFLISVSGFTIGPRGSGFGLGWDREGRALC